MQQKDPLNGAVILDAPAYNDPDSDVTIGEMIPCDEAGFDEVEAALFTQQLGALLDQAMEELPEKQRRAIKLHYLQGRTYNQIADEFQCATSYPGQLVKDGLRKLKTGRHSETLAEILYGERNLYRHTGHRFFRDTGCSVQEYELMLAEKRMNMMREKMRVSK